jgi:hypothetical protein
MATNVTDDRTWRPPRDWKRLAIIGVGLLIVVNLAIIGVYETKTTSDTVALPDAIVQTFPTCGTFALQQQSIGASLAKGYKGELSLDGIALPLDEYDPRALEDGTLSWQPQPDHAFSRITPGQHVMGIFYTPVDPNSSLKPGRFACTFSVT